MELALNSLSAPWPEWVQLKDSNDLDLWVVAEGTNEAAMETDLCWNQSSSS